MTKKKPTPKKLGKLPKDNRSSAIVDDNDAQLRERAFLISDSVEIKSLILIDCAASRSTDLPEGGRRKAELGVPRVAHIFSEEKQGLQVQIEFGLTIKALDSVDEKLDIKATFAIDYFVKTTAKFTEPEYQTFAELNGVHNAWPFWREFVLNLTSRMGIRPIMIPVHRVG